MRKKRKMSRIQSVKAGRRKEIEKEQKIKEKEGVKGERKTDGKEEIEERKTDGKEIIKEERKTDGKEEIKEERKTDRKEKINNSKKRMKIHRHENGKCLDYLACGALMAASIAFLCVSVSGEAIGWEVQRANAVMQELFESETENETGSETETESESETETESESETETESESESGTGSENESETEFESETETESGSESETESERETDTESESESELESESETETEAESETEIASETLPEDPVKETETESQSETGQEAQPEVPPKETETEYQSEMVSETLPEETSKENETEAESETEPETQPQTQPTTKPESQPEIPKETEKKTEKIQRGVHYDIVGDTNAWFRDQNDMLWVRPGSNLYIETIQGSGYQHGKTKNNVQEDGQFTFSLQKTNSDGKVIAESDIRKETYFIDAEAPTAELGISGTSEAGVVYAAQKASVTIRIPPDGKSGLKKASYTYVTCDANGNITSLPEHAAWEECSDGTEINIAQEGTFQVFVRTEDRVGNLAFSQSSPICIDQTPPTIKISGVGDQTANSGAVEIAVKCTDTHYKAGSMQIQIVGKNSGKVPRIIKKQEDEKGASTEYFDFPKEKEYDDVYELSVVAEDLAGNVTKSSMQFSINRFGSVYSLDQATQSSLNQYFIQEAVDIVFQETNIDYVGESSIFCRRDGVMTELKRGVDYFVTMQGSSDSWKEYRYTIPAGYFQKEGIYELLLSSSDRAKNSSDTQIQEKRVTFVLDGTAPDCTVTGIEANGVYRAEEKTAVVIPDDNIGLRKIQVYKDSKLILEKENTDAETVQKISLSAKTQWQTLQVYLCDLAGNEFWSDEIPFYISAEEEAPEQYVKQRKSARELAEEAAAQIRGGDSEDWNTEEGEKNEAPGGSDAEEMSKERAGEESEMQDNGNSSVSKEMEEELKKKENSPEKEGENGNLGEERKETGDSGNKKLGVFWTEEGQKKREFWLLIAGVIVFLLTGSVCWYTGGNRKK